MSPRSVGKDPAEGIRQALGKHVKILFKAPVRLEKGDKDTGKGGQERTLVLTPHRMFVMVATKVPAKIDHQFHYLDLHSIESKKLNQVVFRIHDKAYTFRPSGQVESESSGSALIDQIIITLANAVRNIFPGVLLQHVIPKIEVVPVKRIQSVLEVKPLDFKDMGPCGGFSIQYACYCDYYNMPYREEVAWDVDTIYFSHDSHELALTDFEHLDQKDLICIISALEHNTWFTKLTASSNPTKLSADVIDKILSVVAKSISLQELHLASAGLRSDFFQRLAAAMTSNQYCNLTTLDISLNFVEDRGLSQLASAISHFPRGTRHINLSHCALTGRAVNSLASALVTNKLSLNSLSYLNLSGNSLREEVSNLTDLLAQPNVISILDLSSTDVPSELLFSALVRGCTAHLSHLNLARNPFSGSRKVAAISGSKNSADSVPPSFKQFFAATQALKYLNVSHGKLPVEALKHLLLGLACNEVITDVELNISSNNLGCGGATVIENALPGVRCVSRLDVSENGLDVELSSVVNGVARNRSILSLNISKNLPRIKAKDVVHVTDAIVQLMQDEETSLQKLNLSDCKLKTDLNNVINALGSNQCLQVLDISGNGMGDVGARLLAKALQINTRLRTIMLDRNNISLQGYQDITYALQSNFSMRHIPFPTYDLQPAMRTSPDKVDGIIRRMQDSLQRNSNPRSFRSKNFRLTQGFLLSSTQQVLDKWSAQVQDTIQTVKLESSEITEEVERAEGLIRDAEKCKLLLPSLHESTSVRAESGVGECQVMDRLSQVSRELEEFFAAHLAQNLASMLTKASDMCPSLLSPGSRSRTDLWALAEAKARVPPDFVRNLVMDVLGGELVSKVNEMNLILANHISDKVIDDVIDGLAKSYKTLVGDLGSYKKKRSLTPDVLKGSGGRTDSESDTLSQAGETVSQHSTPSPLSTPALANKRKSIHDRKLRPKSVVDSNSAEELTPGEDDSELSGGARSEAASKRVSGLNGESEDKVPELPEITQLQHLAKNRPRRNKRHASSSVLGQIPSGDASAGESSDQTSQSNIREGLDSFFVKSVRSGGGPPGSAGGSKGSTPLGSPLHQQQAQMEDSAGSSRHGSISSVSSKSREDIRDGKHNLKASSSGKISPLTVESAGGRQSPAPPSRGGGGGLSCLASAAHDEDREEPFQAAPKSPEKKSGSTLSPSGRSLSDLFGKVTHDKVPIKSRGDHSQAPAASSSGPSPFPGRRSDAAATAAEGSVFAARRRSFLTGDTGSLSHLSSAAATDELSPGAGDDAGGDEVTRRARGLGGDILKEMRFRQQEKRASVIPKTGEGGGAAGADDKDKEDAESNPFGNVKLRSISRGPSGLNSPSTDLNSPDSGSGLKQSPAPTESSTACDSGEPTETIKHSSSSIIGLRAATFDTGGSTSGHGSKPADDGSPVMNDDLGGLKPRPPPKPRPWSIVGVDRKSGEVSQVESTSVSGGGGNSGEDAQAKSTTAGSAAASTGGGGGVASFTKPVLTGPSLSSGSGSNNSHRGSVRDMIASLNKPDGTASSGDSAMTSSIRASGSVRDRIANMNKAGGSEAGDVGLLSAAKRKGNSLPRNASDVAANCRPSPKNLRKVSNEDEEGDDPRILKLEDDFIYDDTVNV